jgi:hypothetical protein
MGSPKIPKMPEQKDPILPKQALQPTQSATLQLGRVEGEKPSKKNKGRKALRIARTDRTTQVTGGAAGRTGGLQIGGLS